MALIWYNFYIDTSCSFKVMSIFVFFKNVRNWFRDPQLRRGNLFRDPPPPAIRGLVPRPTFAGRKFIPRPTPTGGATSGGSHYQLGWVACRTPLLYSVHSQKYLNHNPLNYSAGKDELQQQNPTIGDTNFSFGVTRNLRCPTGNNWHPHHCNLPCPIQKWSSNKSSYFRG